MTAKEMTPERLEWLRQRITDGACSADEDALLNHIDALTERLEEREADMHARIRAGYDRCVTDSWKAKLTEVVAAAKTAAIDIERHLLRNNFAQKGSATKIMDRALDDVGGV